MQTSAAGSRSGALHQVTQACTSLLSPSISSSRLRLTLPHSQHLQHLMQPEQAQLKQWGMAPYYLLTLANVIAILLGHMG